MLAKIVLALLTNNDLAFSFPYTRKNRTWSSLELKGLSSLTRIRTDDRTARGKECHRVLSER